MNETQSSSDLEVSSKAEDDVSLMLRVKSGDTEAFEILVERHQHRIVGTVAKMLGNEAEAEDIAQTVFIRVWKSAGRYERRAKFTTWLLTITRNLVFNEMRRRQRTKFVPLETDEEDRPQHQFEDVAAVPPSETVLREEMQAAIDAAIAALPEPQRLAIVLRRYENMPYEEIAQVLKASVPAVKSLLFRARQDLKEALKKYLD